MPIVVGTLGTFPKSLEKDRNNWESGEEQRLCLKNSQNTRESAGNQKSTQTSVNSPEVI